MIPRKKIEKIIGQCDDPEQRQIYIKELWLSTIKEEERKSGKIWDRHRQFFENLPIIMTKNLDMKIINRKANNSIGRTTEVTFTVETSNNEQADTILGREQLKIFIKFAGYRIVSNTKNNQLIGLAIEYTYFKKYPYFLKVLNSAKHQIISINLWKRATMTISAEN